MAVEEGWILALVPRPDEDVIESMVDCVLDGNQVVLIPIPKNGDVNKNWIYTIKRGAVKIKTSLNASFKGLCLLVRELVLVLGEKKLAQAACVRHA